MEQAKKPLIVFGTGKISEAVSYYFNRDSDYVINAYVVDDLFFQSNVFLGKPVVKLSEVAENFAAADYAVFVAVGYQGMNKIRADKYGYFKNRGYTLVSYKSPLVEGDFTFGDNTIIMDGAVIQPKAKFGNNVFVWGGAMVGHHAVIHDHCWLTGGCLIGGAVHLGGSTFIGMGAIVGQEVKIGVECMLGAGSLTVKSIEDKRVVIAEQTPIHRLDSTQFTRMSSCFRV
jgi:sugar O-acyltransferase (sialic acid O-acetyltransferase NeuD family)